MSRVSIRPADLLSMWSKILAVMVMTITATAVARAVSCKTSSDMDAPTHAAIISAAQRYFDLAAKGDTASLRQEMTSGAVLDFAGIEATVKNHQAEIAGSHGATRPPFLLQADGAAKIPHAEFLCGVFDKHGQTPDSAVFRFDDLPPGKYAAVVLDATSSTPPSTVSFLLRQEGTDWKLSGLYIVPAQAAGHGADWFVTRARDYKGKHELYSAWLYYLQARILISPLPFMSTADTDKLYDESQPLQPSDFPSDGKTADLEAGADSYKLTAVFPQAVGNDLDLIVKYQASDVSDSAQAYRNNVTVIKILLSKFPELKDAFDAIVARAVEPSGRDYGTVVRKKEIR